MTTQMRQAPAPESPAWARDMNHGVGIAIAIEDASGEDAARAWFHDHEQLPLHIARECPMRDGPTREGLATAA